MNKKLLVLAALITFNIFAMFAQEVQLDYASIFHEWHRAICMENAKYFEQEIEKLKENEKDPKLDSDQVKQQKQEYESWTNFYKEWSEEVPHKSK